MKFNTSQASRAGGRALNFMDSGRIIFSFVWILALFTFETSTSANLCSTSGLCCRHRDSDCVVQRVYPNHSIVDTTHLPCYCDQACLKLEDCCQDYRQFCGVKDCVVSEWGPWSPCTSPDVDVKEEEGCGNHFGTEERHRVILSQPINGGSKCPHLTQSRECARRQCQQKISDQHSIVNLTLQRPATFNSRPPIIKSLRRMNEDFDEANEVKMGCMELLITKASSGCRWHHDPRLHSGSTICVECLIGGEGQSQADLCRSLASATADTKTGSKDKSKKFRLGPRCHGKVTLASTASPFTRESCQQSRRCKRGLNFEIQN